MTKQEEIREGLATALYWAVPTPQARDWSMEVKETRAIYLRKADIIRSYLKSEGVVIKVIGEGTVTVPRWIWEDLTKGLKNIKVKPLEGYTAVEELI